MNPPNAILHELLNLAEIMLTNGAEVSRVEETLNRMGHAYGATQMNVFAITSSIVVTMVFEEGEEYTQTRRITTPVGTDFFKLEQANALSRRCCSSPLSLADLKYEINKISKISPAPYTIYLGSMLGAGGFSVFFGGTILDGAIAVIFAFLLCFLQRHLNSICSNTLILQFFCSLFVGSGICVAAHFFPVIHADKVMIGDIMLLIPGILMTNSIRDILIGDTISGVMRLVESLLWAGALACGFMCAIWFVGGVVMILQFFAAFIGAAGFGFLFHLQFKHIFPAALGGVLTWVIYVIATIWGFDVFISSLFASAFAAIYSEVIAKIRKAPTTLFLIISVVVLIPGGSLYYTMSYAVQKKWAEAAAYGSQTLQCALGLAIGMSLIWIFHDMARKVYYLIH